MNNIENIKSSLPDFGKDLKLSLGNLVNDDSLTDQQKWGCFVVAALASRNAGVIKAIMAEAESKLSPEALKAAKGAHAIMGMNNIYYRFVHLTSDEIYQTLKANLRMTIIANPGVDKINFELWSLTVSAINGCGMCMESHEKQLRAAGMSAQQIQTSIRIASVMHAVAVTLEGESALSE